mgnify:CR=1 FL=1
MKRIIWLSLGVVAGFAVAHQVSKTEKGKAFFSEVDGRIDTFRSAVSDGFKEREAEIREALDDAKAKIDKLIDEA